MSKSLTDNSDANNDAFVDRLKLVVEGGSVRAFARNAGISDTFLRQCLAGKSEPTRPVLIAIAKAAGVAVQWLATGEGPMRVAEQSGAPLTEAQCRVLREFKHYRHSSAAGEPLATTLLNFVDDYNTGSALTSVIDGIDRLTVEQVEEWLRVEKAVETKTGMSAEAVHGLHRARVYVVPELLVNVMQAVDSVFGAGKPAEEKADLVLKAHTMIYAMASNEDALERVTTADAEPIVALLLKLQG